MTYEQVETAIKAIDSRAVLIEDPTEDCSFVIYINFGNLQFRKVASDVTPEAAYKLFVEIERMFSWQWC